MLVKFYERSEKLETDTWANSGGRTTIALRLQIVCFRFSDSFVVGDAAGLTSLTRRMNEKEAEWPIIWELRRGAEVLATFEVWDQDFPWNYGRIIVGEAFPSISHFFSVQPDRNSTLAVREQLREQGIVMSPRGGAPVREFRLIVDGHEAKFQFV